MLWGWSCLTALAGVAELGNRGAEGHRLNVAPTMSTAPDAQSPLVLPQSPLPAGGEGAGAVAVVCTSGPSAAGRVAYPKVHTQRRAALLGEEHEAVQGRSFSSCFQSAALKKPPLCVVLFPGTIVGRKQKPTLPACGTCQVKAKRSLSKAAPLVHEDLARFPPKKPPHMGFWSQETPAPQGSPASLHNASLQAHGTTRWRRGVPSGPRTTRCCYLSPCKCDQVLSPQELGDGSARTCCPRAAGAGDRAADSQKAFNIISRVWCQSPGEMFRSGFALRGPISYAKEGCYTP